MSAMTTGNAVSGLAPNPPVARSFDAIRIVAADEFRRSVRSRWVFVFAITFAALALGISYFGLAGTGRAGFQGFERVTASLLNLVLLWVPLAAVLLATSRLSGSREALAFHLAQPLARRDALLGRYAGLLGAVVVAMSVGFGGAGVVIASSADAAQARGFVALVGLSAVLAASFLAIGVALAARWPDRTQALGAGLVAWLLATVLYDLAAVGITSVLYGLPVRRILTIAVWLNPVDLCRVLATAALGSHALFGPTGAAVGQFLAGPAGAAAAIVCLVAWTGLPLAFAVRAFSRRDF